MNRRAIAVLGIACLMPLAPLTARADAPNGAVGTGCGLTGVTDPSDTIAYPGTVVGQVTGGPIGVGVLPSDVSSLNWDITGNPASATIVCSVQVGGFGTFTDADVSTASATGTGVVTLPTTIVSFQAQREDPVYLCTTLVLTAAHGETTTLYADSLTGEMVTDPGAAYCDLAIGQHMPPEEVCDLYESLCNVPPGGGPIIDLELWLVTPILIVHLHIVIDYDEPGDHRPLVPN